MGSFLNKSEQNNDSVLRRDPFDDRVCDDLCEEILQYLSLEDKLRLQCVSKQFRRTVFRRQRELCLKDSCKITDNLGKVVETLDKNCPFITMIDLKLDGLYDNQRKWREEKKKLHACITLNDFMKKNKDNFRILKDPPCSAIIHCNNVQELHLTVDSGYLDPKVFENCKFNHLDKVVFHTDKCNRGIFNTIYKFMDNHFKTINLIKLNFDEDNLKNNNIYPILGLFSMFSDKIASWQFDLGYHFPNEYKSLRDCLITISDKFQNTKALGCGLVIKHLDEIEAINKLNHFLLTLNRFTQLKRLDLHLGTHQARARNFDEYMRLSGKFGHQDLDGSIENSIGGFENLTYLSLNINCSFKSTKSTFNSLLNSMNKIKYLRLTVKFDPVDGILDEISKLNNLISVEIIAQNVLAWQKETEQLILQGGLAEIKIMEFTSNEYKFDFIFD